MIAINMNIRIYKIHVSIHIFNKYDTWQVSVFSSPAQIILSVIFAAPITALHSSLVTVFTLALVSVSARPPPWTWAPQPITSVSLKLL